MKRVHTTIGDVFVATLPTNRKRYFQYVAEDSTQLNSDVIKVFKGDYPSDHMPNLNAIVNYDADFYAHVVLNLGLRVSCWEKIGHASVVDDLSVHFRSSGDYGRKVGEKPVRISCDWWVWKLNERRQHVGNLTGEYRDAYIGVVFTPEDIISLMLGHKAPPYYPDFE